MLHFEALILYILKLQPLYPFNNSSDSSILLSLNVFKFCTRQGNQCNGSKIISVLKLTNSLLADPSLNILKCIKVYSTTLVLTLVPEEKAPQNVPV